MGVPGGDVGRYSGYSAEQVLVLPYYARVAGQDVPREDEPAGAYGSLPQGEVGVRRGKRVYASAGEVGGVEGLVIDPGSHHVSHVLVRRGHVGGRRQVAIPIGVVTGVVDSVQLSITRQQVEGLPPVSTGHPDG